MTDRDILVFCSIIMAISMLFNTVLAFISLVSK